MARLPAAALPPAFADSVRLLTVLGMDGVARTRLEAEVRNADRQALEVALPAGAELRTARVAGEAVRPVKTAQGRLLVPLVRSVDPFPVVLVYEEGVEAGSGAASLRAPELGLPGGRFTWTVRLPDGSVAVETSGDFAAPPGRSGTPLFLRILDRVFVRGIVPTAGVPSGRRAPPSGGAAGPAGSVDLSNMMEEPQAEEAPEEEEGTWRKGFLLCAYVPLQLCALIVLQESN